MELNYKFMAAGLLDIAKTVTYKMVLEPVPEKPSILPKLNNKKAKLPLVGRIAKDGENYLDDDFLGKNIICPVIFKKKKKKFELQEAIVSLTKTKRIVKTEIVGGNGTVKEFIGEDDMNITITTAVVATDAEGNMIDEYPGQAVKDIQTYLDAKNIEVWSPFLSLFGIDGGELKIVVESYDIDQTTYTSRQLITIKAISDVDYTIFAEE
jgi:hypothetical protein